MQLLVIRNYNGTWILVNSSPIMFSSKLHKNRICSTPDALLRQVNRGGVYLEMLWAQFATEELVLLPHVLLQLLKSGEDFRLRTARALRRQQVSDPKQKKKMYRLFQTKVHLFYVYVYHFQACLLTQVKFTKAKNTRQIDINRQWISQYLYWA